MKTLILNPTATRNCEGVSRRDFLKAGALTAFGLSLADYFHLRSAAAAAAPKADAVILLWMAGGPSHLDSFDPKPEAPAEIRGEFSAIPTKVDGIQVSEHLSRTAQVMDRVALVRSLTSNIAAHEQASQYLMTGYRPLPTLEYPSYGSVVAKELGVRNDLPPYVAIPGIGRGGQSGFIGAGYNAFTVPDPSARNFQVQDIRPPAVVDDARLQRRRAFTDRMNGRFAGGFPDDNVRSVDTFYEQAYDLVTSPSAKKAFDIDAEPQSVREAYGSTTCGQGALLARRLVEGGARFVTVQKGGWDTHQNNFNSLSQRLLPELDQAYSALLNDLSDRGMLDRTLVVLMGEFGRTPRINGRGGRDHWSRCRFVAFAGAGIRGGQAIGRSDAEGGVPAERPVSVEDVATTLYSALGVDYRKQYVTPTGRPIHLAQNGSVIRELWGV
ncbi:MAG: DUF1501 domain-containing protein [Armatimonadota bacterium]